MKKYGKKEHCKTKKKTKKKGIWDGKKTQKMSKKRKTRRF